MKTPDLALTEWVSDAITFDWGMGTKIWTQNQFEGLSKYVNGDEEAIIEIASIRHPGVEARFPKGWDYASRFIEPGIAKMVRQLALMTDFAVTPRTLLVFDGLDEMHAKLVKLYTDKNGEPPIQFIPDTLWRKALTANLRTPNP